MHDETESIRRTLVNEISGNPGEREALEAKYGQVWDTEELRRDFEVRSFFAPFIFAKRISDGLDGTLTFQHNPRFYFNWSPNS